MRNLTQEICLLLNVKILYRVYENFFSSYRYYMLSHVQYTITATFVPAVPIQRTWELNPLNAELNPICYLLTLLGDHPIFHISRIRVKHFQRCL